jgi:UrcA family protein
MPTSLFSFIIGRKSALYQLHVLTNFSRGPQPPSIALTRSAKQDGVNSPMRNLTKRKLNAKPAAIMVSLAVLAFGFAAPAGAQAWKVGSTYVIRHQHLDLDRPADRLALLVQVERSATKLCEGVRTNAKRQACREASIAESLAAASPEVRGAVRTARLERDGEKQAQR